MVLSLFYEVCLTILSVLFYATIVMNQTVANGLEPVPRLNGLCELVCKEKKIRIVPCFILPQKGCTGHTLGTKSALNSKEIKQMETRGLCELSATSHSIEFRIGLVPCFTLSDFNK